MGDECGGQLSGKHTDRAADGGEQAAGDSERGTATALSPADTQEMLKFLSSTLVGQLHRHSSESDRWREAKDRISGAFLFLDVCGMHELSEALPTFKPVDAFDAQAAEQRRASILAAMVRTFEQLVATTRAHGGDVVKFTGDAMLVVWQFPRSGPERLASSSRAVVSACRCALDLMRLSGTLLWSDKAEDGAEAMPAQPMLEARDAAVRKVERLRELGSDASGFDTLNQGVSGCGVSNQWPRTARRPTSAATSAHPPTPWRPHPRHPMCGSEAGQPCSRRVSCCSLAKPSKIGCLNWSDRRRCARPRFTHGTRNRRMGGWGRGGWAGGAVEDGRVGPWRAHPFAIRARSVCDSAPCAFGTAPRQRAR